MIRHTPGPWSVDPEGAVAVSIEGADGSVVCDVHGGANDPCGTSNASLIVTAPEMLAALESIAQGREINAHALRALIARANGTKEIA